MPMIEPSEVILTPRLSLRPMRASDAPFIVAWRSRPEDAQSFLGGQNITLESHLKWFHSARPGRLDYMIDRRDDGRCIGTLHFKNIDTVSGTAESGRMIGELDCRGQGFGKESAIGWFRFGFEQLKLKRIYSLTSAGNTANLALNASLGAVIEACGPADGVQEGFVRCVLTLESARGGGLFWPNADSPTPSLGLDPEHSRD